MAVDKSEARVRRMFGEIASRYDFLNHFLSCGVDYYWRWRTVRVVPPTGDVPVLDLCTGTGDLALAYAKAGNGKTPVVGADFCHPMLVLGREKARQAGASQVVFVEADAQQLPFEPETFQIVCVAFGLRNVTDTDRGLREMLRVCRSGGRVAVLEFSKPSRWPLSALYSWYFRHILPRLGRALSPSGNDAYNYLPESVGEFPHGEALAERMRQAGAKDVRFLPLSFGIATLYLGSK
jgi:demethylmenaquinone methyltransferase/2-methoxy-6-polyprenyl-1,4-benzoquinol methylase